MPALTPGNEMKNIIRLEFGAINCGAQHYTMKLSEVLLPPTLLHAWINTNPRTKHKFTTSHLFLFTVIDTKIFYYCHQFCVVRLEVICPVIVIIINAGCLVFTQEDGIQAIHISRASLSIQHGYHQTSIFELTLTSDKPQSCFQI